MTIPFVKMHGAANDFVMIDHRDPFLPAEPGALVRRMCDRRRGIGADGVLLLERDPDLDFAMRYFNSDGHTVSYCGNGARCISRFALDLGLGRDGAVRFRTDAGVQTAHGTGAGVSVRFGRVNRPGAVETVQAAGRSFEGFVITAGVPHFVVEVEDLAAVPLVEWGRALRLHDRFRPDGTNVDFISRDGIGRVAMRTYERGVEDETMACGSGAMASALSALLDGAASPVTVLTAGGDTLEVAFEEDGADGWIVTLSGPAEIAFRGSWDDSPAD